MPFTTTCQSLLALICTLYIIYNSKNITNDDYEIPLLGTVAAGQPIEAILTHDTVSVPRDMTDRERVFALRVRGDSMIEEHIQDGDIIDIDIPSGALSVRLSQQELADRRAAWTAPAPKTRSSYLARYARVQFGQKWTFGFRASAQDSMMAS